MANEKLNCLRVKTPSGWETPGEIYKKNANGTWTRTEDFYFKVGGIWKDCEDSGCGEFLDTFSNVEGITIDQHTGESGHSWVNIGDRNFSINNSDNGGAMASPDRGDVAFGCSASTGIDSGICSSAISNYKIVNPAVGASCRFDSFNQEATSLALYWDGLTCEKTNGIFISANYVPADNSVVYYKVTIDQYVFGNLVASASSQIYSHPSYNAPAPSYADVDISISNLEIEANVTYDGDNGPYPIRTALLPYKQNNGVGIISAGYAGIDNLEISCE